uniref:OSJNBa0089N06.11 protein n=1 Tax=Oryza sativa subsp. japonica TaxID=39947 RepID=Q7XN71_ORYSJ|nr:OSJNBa0089N06.11 [Oryza sativa Japonica Group]
MSSGAAASAAGVEAGAAGGGKDDELADLVRRLVDALARYSDRLPFDLDRQVTCRLLGVILEETTPEELQNHVTVRPSVLEVLLEIAKFCDVYLMERILDDESGEKVLSALSEAGLFTNSGLIKDKVLFCSTENGRTSFVRQLEPDWHIDTSPEIVHQLAVSSSKQWHSEN